jgi:hypothetical protein
LEEINLHDNKCINTRLFIYFSSYAGVVLC